MSHLFHCEIDSGRADLSQEIDLLYLSRARPNFTYHANSLEASVGDTPGRTDDKNTCGVMNIMRLLSRDL